MAKYIDAEKIRAEIERRKKENMYYELPMTIGRYYEDRDLLQKPVEWSEDFDKEVENIHKRYPEVSYAKLTRIAYHFSKWANRRKDIEWSEEDEYCWNLIWDILDGSFACSKEGYKKASAWFLKNCPKGTKSLRPVKQEWSEEDRRIADRIQMILEFYDRNYPGDGDIESEVPKYIYWLKSLRPVSKESLQSWKPSEDEERLINTSISFLKDFADKGYENAVECIDWLKSKLNGNTCK